MEKQSGHPLPLGATYSEGCINFSVAVPKGNTCELLLYHTGETSPAASFLMEEGNVSGDIRCITVSDPTCTEYLYRVNGKYMIDPYAHAIVGREVFGAPHPLEPGTVRARVCKDAYDWEGDVPLSLPWQQVIAYSLHVRGFTSHLASGVKNRGTFSGVVEKLAYLKELGINQIHCMPVYDFEENQLYRNYWGYGPGYYFAPKGSYAATDDPVTELKDMIRLFHKAGIEVVLEMPFTAECSWQMITDCLRYYVTEYHVDGFILNPYHVSMAYVRQDPFLKQVKLMEKQDGFQNVMRRFLKGDEGTIPEVMQMLRHHSAEDGLFHYITGHTGFTLSDLVSYDGKHNEQNGERGTDGPEYNYSWNCGVEGPTRKRNVMKLRRQQIRNAFFLLLTAQGTPCILAGDEFGNSQGGNNNVYCQDNETGWLSWDQYDRNKELVQFVKSLIAFRRKHAVFGLEEGMKGADGRSYGIPDVSYHGESAWRVPDHVASRSLGVYYCGQYAEDCDCFVAYNMHWEEHSFALPAPMKGTSWYESASTGEGIYKEPVRTSNQKAVTVSPRTILILTGRTG